jgi:hypothetical protein
MPGLIESSHIRTDRQSAILIGNRLFTINPELLSINGIREN